MQSTLNQQREPIAALRLEDDKPFIIFPSLGRAAAIIGVSRMAISYAISKKYKTLGFNWRIATSSEFRTQYMTLDGFQTAIDTMNKNKFNKN